MRRCAVVCLLAAMLAAACPAYAAVAPSRAADYALRHGAAALVVLQGDRIVLERYAHDLATDGLQMLFSGSKSFSCVIAAAAVDDGLVAWDAPVERHLDEWRGTGRSGVTVRNLLALDSGLDPARGSGRDRVKTTEQTVSAALQARVAAPPGRSFGYGPYPFLVFSEVIRRATGSEADAYLARRVLAPIGTRVEWIPTADGRAHLADGALATVHDWLAFGRLVRDGGRWQGGEVVRGTTLGECFRPSRANRSYGLGWWLDIGGWRCRVDARAADRPCVVSALGRGGTALHVLAEDDLVVLVLGRTRAARGEELDQTRLLRLLQSDLGQAAQ